MAERFMLLSPAEQSEVIDALAARLGRPPAILEKDVWVCWALGELFAMPGRVRMAFKGGTSLSKVFGAIHRFSEDIDVMLDYRELNPSEDPLAPGLSRSKQKRIADELRGRVRDHVYGVVAPYFESLIVGPFEDRGMRVECDDAGEKVALVYGAVAPDRPAYLSDSILLEFGGRNITEPNEEHRIDAYMSGSAAEGLEFPTATVDVLSPARTFWEKATLIHAECNRGQFKAGVRRLSRHWYDLAMLAEHDISRRALEDRELLESVVRHKKVFFHSGYANYQACLEGGLRLVPTTETRLELERDYNAMVDAGMFDETPPAFAEVLRTLETLERQANLARG